MYVCFVHNLCLVILQRESLLHRLRFTPLGFYLRVFVNETHINLEKTTSSVLSVILINPWVKPVKKGEQRKGGKGMEGRWRKGREVVTRTIE